MIKIDKVVGLKKFNRRIRKFTGKEQIKIVQDTMRGALTPGRRVLKATTPVSKGADHRMILRRKLMKGQPIVPAHAKDAAVVSVKKFSRSIVGALWYKKGFAWYIYILSHGFLHVRSGKKIPPRKFATSVIAERERYVRKNFPRKLAETIDRRLKKRLRK